MAGASRCFASEFLQLGGPDALVSGERLRCVLYLSDFPFTHFHLSPAARFLVTLSNLEAASRWASELHDQKGEEATAFVADW
jgi:hypothetical protein